MIMEDILYKAVEKGELMMTLTMKAKNFMINQDKMQQNTMDMDLELQGRGLKRRKARKHSKLKGKPSFRIRCNECQSATNEDKLCINMQKEIMKPIMKPITPPRAIHKPNIPNITLTLPPTQPKGGTQTLIKTYFTHVQDEPIWMKKGRTDKHTNTQTKVQAKKKNNKNKHPKVCSNSIEKLWNKNVQVKQIRDTLDLGRAVNISITSTQQNKNLSNFQIILK